MSAEDMNLGAIPFCFTHDTNWASGCAECDVARPILDAAQAHAAATGCTTWPLCEEAHWAGEDG